MADEMHAVWMEDGQHDRLSLSPFKLGYVGRQNQERTPQEGSSEITSKRSALLPAVSDRTTASHHASSPLGLMRPARFCGTKQVERRRALGALESKAEDQLAEATQLPSRLMGPANNMYERAKALEVLGPRGMGKLGGSTNHTRLSGLALALGHARRLMQKFTTPILSPSLNQPLRNHIHPSVCLWVSPPANSRCFLMASSPHNVSPNSRLVLRIHREA